MARGNIRGFYPSLKMAQSIQFESGHSELPAIIEMEHSFDVLEFWDQPEPIRLSYINADGRRCTYEATPDFLVMRQESVGWMECKLQEELLELVKEGSTLYCLDEKGIWRCPPGEQYAAQFGLTFTVYAAGRDGAPLTRNLNFLEDYFRPSCPKPSPALEKEVISIVRLSEGIRYPDLLKSVAALTRDNLNYLIAHFSVYVDLRNVLLVDSESVAIYTDSTAAIAAKALVDAQVPVPSDQSGVVKILPTERIRMGEKTYTIIEAETKLVQMLDEEGRVHHLKRSEVEIQIRSGNVQCVADVSRPAQAIETALKELSPVAQGIAVSHWQKLQPYLGPNASRVPQRNRSIRRWLRAYRRAQEADGNGFLGLLPKPRPGNNTSRVHADVEGIIEIAIKEDFETEAAPNLTKVYGRVVRDCELRGLEVPSFKTFSLRVRMRPQHPQRLKRGGKRVAYQKRKFHWYLDQHTPVHGDRSWEIVHIDHTLADIELVDSLTGENLGRPWITIMIDAHTRMILAVVVSFFGESAESCMRILRACVKRHARLPQCIVVDQGKSFENLYFDTALARYEVRKKTRPAAHARHGSVCERIIGSLNTLFTHNLNGNTKVTKNVRQVTPSVDPKNLAVWTFAEFQAKLTEFCFEVYNRKIHPALGMSPEDYMHRSGAVYGARAHVYIGYDNQFRILTMPSTKRGTAKVHAQKGVHINHLDYWCDEFAEPGVEGKDVPVRFDSDDVSSAHAFVRNQWRPCISSYAAVFRNWSTRQLTALAEEFRARHRMVGRKKIITARALADFMHEVGAMEAVMKIRRLERESRSEKTVEPVLPKSSADEQIAATEAVPEADTHQPVNEPEISECTVSYL